MSSYTAVRLRLLALATLLTGTQLPQAGCLPLTFSNDGAIDFEAFPSVYVPPVLDPGGGRSAAEAVLGYPPRDYLIDELGAYSGFELVTSDPEAQVSLTLYVTLDYWEEVTESYATDDWGNVIVDEEVDYHAEASFEAVTQDGHVIDAGSVEDSSGTEEETIEDTLDELVNHFLIPYRI